MEVEQELDLLEKGIRQLQIEWDKFFGGVEKKPPWESKNRVEQMIRKYVAADIARNIDRFRYQTLTARYNTFNELWARKLRALEEGRPMGIHGRYLAQVAPEVPPPAATPPAPPPEPARPRPPAAPPAPAGVVRVQDPQRDAELVKGLYQAFLAARKSAGEAGVVKLEAFQKIIGQQSQRILSEKGCSAVEFRLETKDGKVSLKAKAVR